MRPPWWSWAAEWWYPFRQSASSSWRRIGPWWRFYVTFLFYLGVLVGAYGLVYWVLGVTY